MLLFSVILTQAAGFAGVYASFFLDSAPAPTVVLILTAVFLIAFAWQQWRISRASKTIRDLR
jgi:manganese/iron transport system permease protein